MLNLLYSSLEQHIFVSKRKHRELSIKAFQVSNISITHKWWIYLILWNHFYKNIFWILTSLYWDAFIGIFLRNESATIFLTRFCLHNHVCLKWHGIFKTLKNFSYTFSTRKDYFSLFSKFYTSNFNRWFSFVCEFFW